MTHLVLSTFRWAPPFAQGIARDIRVRWALEEAGLDYDVDLIAFGEHKSEAYRQRQPFGQIPAVSLDGAAMFETGAILYALGLKSTALMPADDRGRIDTIQWMFAALNTVEPRIQALVTADFSLRDSLWNERFRPGALEGIGERLQPLDGWLAANDYLAGQFTIADILMTTTLRFLRHTDMIARYSNIAAYLERCEARPGFQAALAAQMAGYAENAPIVSNDD